MSKENFERIEREFNPNSIKVIFESSRLEEITNKDVIKIRLSPNGVPRLFRSDGVVFGNVITTCDGSVADKTFAIEIRNSKLRIFRVPDYKIPEESVAYVVGIPGVVSLEDKDICYALPIQFYREQQ